MDTYGILGPEKPLPFRGGVGVGIVSRRLTAPTPCPSPEGEGGSC